MTLIEKHSKNRPLKVCMFILALFGCTKTLAAEGGYSNYIPGFYGDVALAMAISPGFTVKNDIYYYTAQSSKNIINNTLAADLDIEILYNYTSLLYKTDYKIFGAEYAVMLTAIYGGPDLEASISSANQQLISVSKDSREVGDITFSPMILYWNDGNYNYSFAQYIVAPTASYDSDDLANSGLNYWTFESDFVASYTDAESGQDYSVVFGYNYNTENKDTNYQTGQELHIDVVLNQFLSESFAIGVQAFHLQQINKDDHDQNIPGSFKARATGIGPSLIWIPESLNGKAMLTAKWIKEVEAENRLKGEHMFFTFAMSF